MESFLKTIADETALRVERRKKQLPLEKIKETILSASEDKKPQSFGEAIFNKKNTQPAIIAEAKKASPSSGVLRPIYNIREIVTSYIAGGAQALSILTEEKYFMGDIYHIVEARQTAGDIPILRKDFIIDEYQIYESRYYGADAILLIKSLLASDEKFLRLAETAINTGLDVIAEIHNEKELSAVLNSRTNCIVGVNSRNLDNFQIDADKAIDIISNIPKDRRVIAESGIKTSDDILKILRARETNIAFLIGTSLITAINPGSKLKEIIHAVMREIDINRSH